MPLNIVSNVLKLVINAPSNVEGWQPNFIVFLSILMKIELILEIKTHPYDEKHADRKLLIKITVGYIVKIFTQLKSSNDWKTYQSIGFFYV